jgi:uncharacterized protein YjbJ (UPF0337 family)
VQEKGAEVNADVIKGKWHQLKGDIRHRWGKLSDNDLDDVHGDFDEFIGKLQERYGYARDRARRELNEFMDSSDITAKPKR